MPFADYANFEDCVRKNRDKKDPEAYCAVIKRQVEGKTYSFFTDRIAPDIVEMKDGSKNFYATGYISTGKKDLYNDIVTEGCMEDMVTQLKSGNIKVDVEHEAFRDNAAIIPVGRIVESKKDEKGVWAKVQLNPDSPKFKNVWNSVKNGFIDAFSITYKPVKTLQKKVGGVVARILDKVDLVNVAMTGTPVNTSCKIMDVFTKSINDLEATRMEAQEKADYPWDKCIGDQMKRYGSMTKAKKICGAIRSGTVKHKGGEILLSNMDDFVNLKSILEVKDTMTEEEVKQEAPVEEAKVEETEAPAEEAVEEKKEETAPAEEAPVEEATEASEEEAPAEPESKSINALKEEISELKAEMKALKTELSKPQFKALKEEAPKVEEKAKSPLEMI